MKAMGVYAYLSCYGEEWATRPQSLGPQPQVCSVRVSLGCCQTLAGHAGCQCRLRPVGRRGPLAGNFAPELTTSLAKTFSELSCHLSPFLPSPPFLYLSSPRPALQSESSASHLLLLTFTLPRGAPSKSLVHIIPS